MQTRPDTQPVTGTRQLRRVTMAHATKHVADAFAEVAGILQYAAPPLVALVLLYCASAKPGV